METVILYPSPGIGHVISMVELGKLLLSHNPSLKITILSPTFLFNRGSYSSYISSVSAVFPSISFHSLPAVPLLLGDPSEYDDMEQILFETHFNVNPHVAEYLQSLSQSTPVSAFIIDFFCYPALEIAQSLKIPTYFFITTSASCLALFLNFPVYDKIVPESFRDFKGLFEIPGLFGFPASDMIESMLDRGVSYYEFVIMSTHLPKANGIIINTFEKLEFKLVKALKEGICLPGVPIPPLYCMGPLIADRAGDERSEKVGERDECLSWLDSQPSRSVVYLGFGSRGFFSKEQIREIAVGLERSGVRYLWVVRAPPNEDKAKQYLPPPEPDLDMLLPEGFLDRTKDRGLVVKLWVPQIEVLAHGSVAAFVTHCGWNSILEAVEAGMPVVAWPLYAEQRFNKILLVKEMGIALPMDEMEDRFVSSNEVERRVKQVINSEEGDAIRERILGFSHEAKAALEDGGSSRMALAKLVKSWK